MGLWVNHLGRANTTFNGDVGMVSPATRHLQATGTSGVQEVSSFAYLLLNNTMRRVFLNKKLQVGPPGEPRRGRPPKFGRPARLVAVTLPNDVVEELVRIDPDVGRAIVRMHDETRHHENRAPRQEPPGAELIDVGGGRGLIVVYPALVRDLSGVAAIPFGEDRAFLALEPHRTMADLELSVLDALERRSADGGRSRALSAFRKQLREWRTNASISLEPRAIIVARRHPAGRQHRPSPR